MPALGERLFATGGAAVTILREFGGACGNFEQGAASLCNRAFQMIYEHPWGMKTHTLAIPFLPASIGNLFDAKSIANAHNLVDESPMQTLAMGSQCAFLMGYPSSCGQIALTVLPGETLLATLLDLLLGHERRPGRDLNPNTADVCGL